MALNDVELAALDLLIAMKESGAVPAGFIDAGFHVNNLGDVAVAAASVAAVAAAVGVAAQQAPLAGAAPGPGLSLQDLKDIRANAVQARTNKP